MMKGALVELLPAATISVPNVVVFQFNPEKLSHNFTQPGAEPAATGAASANPLAVAGEPGETFSFTLYMTAADRLPDASQAERDDAKTFGLYTRLSALELLVYPSAVADVTAALAGEQRQT